VISRSRTLAGEYRLVLDARLRHLVRVDQPLLLITQMQRSGGTLLLRLFDGHPECHVVVHQLGTIERGIRRRPDGPDRAWRELHDPKLVHRFHAGHRQQKHDVLRDEQLFSFLLPPGLQREIYDRCVAGLGGPSPRGLLDCYLTSYFNAWLDNRNLYAGRKRWVVGFEPALARSVKVRRRVPKVYPDGRVISIVRDPWSWYASARRWEPRWRDRTRALDDWTRVAEATLAWKDELGEALRLVSFAELLRQTEETMRSLADWLEIDFRPELLEPTFNGLPITANSSFGDVAGEVSTEPLRRGREELDDGDERYVAERAGDLHERLAGLVTIAR
jgi:hypothetical protein